MAVNDEETTVSNSASEFKSEPSPSPSLSGSPLATPSTTGYAHDRVNTNGSVNSDLEQHVRETMPILAAQVTAATESADPNQATKQRPPLSYARLAALAIVALDCHAKVTDIYEWIEEKYPYYRSGTTWWKNCIRHNLSIKKFFERKGPYWHHIAALDDMADMKVTKHHNKRLKEKKGDKSKNNVRASLSNQDPALFNQWGMPQYHHVGYGMPGGMPTTPYGHQMPDRSMMAAHPAMIGQPYMMPYQGPPNAQSQQLMMQQMMLQRMHQLQRDKDSTALLAQSSSTASSSSSKKRPAEDSHEGVPRPKKLNRSSDRAPSMVDSVQAQVQQHKQQLQMQEMMLAYMSQQQQQQQQQQQRQPQQQQVIPPSHSMPMPYSMQGQMPEQYSSTPRPMMVNMFGGQQQYMMPTQYGKGQAPAAVLGSSSIFPAGTK